MNPPDWAYARFVVQQCSKVPVGQLVAYDFLDIYWNHQQRFKLDTAGKLDQHAENVRAKRLRDRMSM